MRSGFVHWMLGMLGVASLGVVVCLLETPEPAHGGADGIPWPHYCYQDQNELGKKIEELRSECEKRSGKAREECQAEIAKKIDEVERKKRSCLRDPRGVVGGASVREDPPHVKGGISGGGAADNEEQQVTEDKEAKGP